MNRIVLFYRTHRSWLISVVFFLPIAALIVQFALISMSFGEPYPGLMMPGFTGTQMTPDGNVTVVTVDIQVGFADTTSTEQLSLAQLLGPMPASMFGAVSWNVFHSMPKVAGDVLQPRKGLKAWLVDHVIPHRTLRFRRMATGNSPAPDTIQWLQARLGVLYPEHRAQWIDFRWYQNSYRLRHTAFDRVSHALLDSYRIEMAR
jgi:hypothetical protein